MYKNRKFLLFTASVALSGCVSGGVSDPSQLQPLPPAQKIELVGKQAYIANLGRNPRNFRVVKVSSASFLGDRDWDHYACVTATERQTGDIYNSAGKLISKEGSDYTETYVMTFRDYSSRYSSDGWGAGVFRRVTDATKIMDKSTASLCSD